MLVKNRFVNKVHTTINNECSDAGSGGKLRRAVVAALRTHMPSASQLPLVVAGRIEVYRFQTSHSSFVFKIRSNFLFTNTSRLVFRYPARQHLQFWKVKNIIIDFIMFQVFLLLYVAARKERTFVVQSGGCGLGPVGPVAPRSTAYR